MAKRRTSGEGSVYQRGSDGRWVAALSIPGRPRLQVYATTKREVLQKRREVERRLEQGLPAVDRAVTVTALFDEWFESLRVRRSTGTLRYYQGIARTHILGEVASWKVSGLQAKDVDRMVSKALDSGYSNTSVRRVRSLLVSVLKFAQSRGYVSRNVAAETQGIPEEPHIGRTLTPEQARTLLDAFAANERWGAAFTVMLGLGLRRGEVLRLRWSDVDLAHGALTVRDSELGRTKTRASVRTIDLPGFVFDSLVSHRSRHPGIGDTPVFPNTVGKPQDPQHFYAAFVKVATDALGEPWHPHEMRHTAASLMLAAGVPLEVVSKVLGHSKVSTTASTYAHLLPAAYQDAATKMNQMVGTSR